jgi:tetratricopeptide (TPR) repeat protein
VSRLTLDADFTARHEGEVLGLLSFRRRTLSDDELRDALFDAAAASNTRLVKKLAASHLERIIALFPGWKVLPPTVRSDPIQTRWWAEGVIAAASAAAALGHDSLIEQLQGKPEENVLVSWQNAFLAAQADENAGNHASAIATLEQILEKISGLTGTAVDDLLPKTYGLLGTAYYRAGDRERARAATSRARDLCVRVADREGVQIYTANLHMIEQGDRLIFRDAQGRLLTPEEMQVATGSLQYEFRAVDNVSTEADALHQQGREAGARGDYDQALALFTRAAKLAPSWPYPVYDRAYTHLLMKDFDAALSDYRKTSEMAPRGFFTTLPAVHTLSREQQGDLPRGLYLAFLTLEQITDAKERRLLLREFVERHPGFAPAWQKFADLAEDHSERLTAIERGLAADPDRETKGMLSLNKALALLGSGDSEGGIEVLRGLAMDQESTLATEALAKAMLERFSKY